jgi:hypothetical protein
MKPAKIILILLIVTATLLLGPFSADSIALETGEGEQTDQGENQEGWLDLWTRVQKIRLDRMKEFLKLDEKTMDMLAPRLNQLDKKKKEIGKERLFLMKQLKQSTKHSTKNEQLQDTLRRLEENQAALEILNQEHKGLLKTHLTLEQQAKYILFQRAFKEELRDIIQKERGAAKGGR